MDCLVRSVEACPLYSNIPFKKVVESRSTLQGVDLGLSRANFAGVTSRFVYLIYFMGACTLLSLGCSSRVDPASLMAEASRDNPTRFRLSPGRDVGQVLDGNTFLANLQGVHPLLGQSVPIRIRGFSAPNLPPEDNAQMPAAISAWTHLRRTLEDARDVELRLLERGSDGSYLIADVYLDDSSEPLRGEPPL